MAFAGRFLSRNLQDSNTHLGRWGDSGYAAQGNRAFIVSHTTYTIITTTTITIIINVTNKRINILITVLNIIITMGASNEFEICCDLFVQRTSFG